MFLDDNEAPTDIALDSATVAENASGAIIGNVTVTDPDAGDTHTLTVDDTRFEIAGTTLRLKAGQSLDHETEPTVTVNITATDQGGLSRNENFTITVTDVNDNAPVVTPSQTFSTNESANNGTTVGTVAATDVDTVGSLSGWTIISGNGDNIFAINASTGQISIVDNTNLDFETTSFYDLVVTVSDGVNTSANETVRITVSDANEAPTDITLDNSTVQGGSRGAIVGEVAAFDPDAGDTHSFNIRSAILGLPSSMVSHPTKRLRLKSDQSIDATFEPTINLLITATDAGGLSHTEQFTIAVIRPEVPTFITTRLLEIAGEIRRQQIHHQPTLPPIESPPTRILAKQMAMEKAIRQRTHLIPVRSPVPR